jgi:hypothetical protein
MPTASQITPARMSLSEVGATFTLRVRASITSGGTGCPLSIAARSVDCISMRSRLLSQTGTMQIAPITRNRMMGIQISHPWRNPLVGALPLSAAF